MLLSKSVPVVTYFCGKCPFVEKLPQACFATTIAMLSEAYVLDELAKIGLAEDLCEDEELSIVSHLGPDYL